MSVKPKKHLGQHFLTAKDIAKRIAECGAQDMIKCPTVIEIGPGMGALTTHLEDILEKKQLFLSEIDQESIAYLKTQYGFAPEQIIDEDFLKLDLSKYESPLHITGNFPYNISSQIVFKILDNITIINSMHGMFQKEVAERICAAHGSKIYGILSVLTQAYYHCEYSFTVNEGAFNPPPKVKSGVMRMHKKEQMPDLDYLKFKKIVKAAFGLRRKTLRNSLKPFGIGDDHAFSQKRPEQLSVEEFMSLAKDLGA